ncbi:MAG: EamA family transporter [Armatimonadota bacterium]|nr:EamA family transporter [Armatimonadota bacterium]MDR7438480.1 EamA family transporter [Armatimonadota bacterium]MDR7563177.1 EamA family transporter [Armatimonadota bacterium]MDR7567573.1 EamA family transporter [Armatimonadota bacterium]MDR7602022.1 EamA family transporter [Armatimonadota bacterium]
MIGELFALLAALAFALSTVLAHWFMTAHNPVRPEAGVLVSMTTNVAVFGALLLLELTRGLPPLTPLSLLFFLLGGLWSTMVGRNLSYLSVLHIGPARSTAIRLSNTLFAALIGLVGLGELPRPIQLGGAFLITAGLWLVISERSPAGRGRPDPRGVLAALGAAVAFALGDTCRRAGLRITPAPFLGATLGAAMALVAQLGWFAARRLQGGGVRIVWRGDVLGSALTNTAAILLLFLALQRTTVANAAVLYNLQVLFVILLSRWMLPEPEPASAPLVAGSLLCTAGTAGVLFG